MRTMLPDNTVISIKDKQTDARKHTEQTWQKWHPFLGKGKNPSLKQSPLLFYSLLLSTILETDVNVLIFNDLVSWYDLPGLRYWWRRFSWCLRTVLHTRGTRERKPHEVLRSRSHSRTAWQSGGQCYVKTSKRTMFVVTRRISVF